jgi:hypothetical protein
MLVLVIATVLAVSAALPAPLSMMGEEEEPRLVSSDPNVRMIDFPSEAKGYVIGFEYGEVRADCLSD